MSRAIIKSIFDYAFTGAHRRRIFKSTHLVCASISRSFGTNGGESIEDLSLVTKFVHAGAKSDASTGAVISPIHLSTTFERDDNLELPHGFLYSRISNPTRKLLENTFAELESGKEGFAFSSGMAAASAILTACPNSHVILPDDLYHGIFVLVKDVFAKWGLTFEKVDMTDTILLSSALDKAYASSKRVVLWMETPSNPSCKVTDIEQVVLLAKSKIKEPERLITVTDSTWTTPYLLRPLELGSDIVLHSTTKYVGGHSDVLGGLLVTSDSKNCSSIIDDLKRIHQTGGAVCSPFDSYLLLRGLRTLPVRMKEHCNNAMALAQYLTAHDRVEHVYYPGLPNHPQHKLAAKQMKGRFGGMLSFRVKGTFEDPDGFQSALKVWKSVKLLKKATSLGGTESLIEHRRSVEGAYPVSPPNLLRVSVGLEEIRDLMKDLDSALMSK